MRKFSVSSHDVKVMQSCMGCSVEEAKKILFKTEYLALIEEAKTVDDLKAVLFDFVSRTY